MHISDFPDTEDMATIILARPHASVWVPRKVTVTVNGKNAIDLPDRSFTVLNLPPGALAVVGEGSGISSWPRHAISLQVEPKTKTILVWTTDETFVGLQYVPLMGGGMTFIPGPKAKDLGWRAVSAQVGDQLLESLNYVPLP